jgi:hypothetical protein
MKKLTVRTPCLLKIWGVVKQTQGEEVTKEKKNRAKLENALIFLVHFQVLPVFLCDFLCASFDTREDYKREEACMFAFSLEGMSKFERHGLKLLWNEINVVFNVEKASVFKCQNRT